MKNKVRILSLYCFIIFCTPSYSQIITPPVLYGNNGTSDINFLTCASLTPLVFNSSFAAMWESGLHTWTLYKDGVEIDSDVQLLTCHPNPNCQPPGTCPIPNITFGPFSPSSGSYQIRLQIEKYIFVGIKCSGVWINSPFAGITYDKYSNIINVTRFDDGFECPCGTPANLTVPCTIINNPVPPIPLTFRAVNNVTMSCPINNNKTVTLIAGDKISLQPGFRSGTGGNTHFRAYLDQCNMRIMNPDNSDSTIIDDTLVQSPTTQTPINQNTELNRETQNQDMVIYPNPNHGYFDVFINDDGQEDAAENSNYQLAIYNTLGEKVYSTTVNGKQETANLSSHPAGIYFIKVISKENIYTEKVIIQ